MVPATVHGKATKGLIQAALRGALTQAQARRLAKENPEVLALALLAASQRIAEQELRIAQLQARGDGQKLSPSTPSGMVPIYTKPNTAKRCKKSSARNGHEGVRRQRPVKIDERRTHRLPRCPDCGGRLQRCHRSRTRIIEDLPEVIEPVVTEHTIYRDYCPRCRKDVEPVVPDAMPKATLGHHLVALTSWFHYGLGLTIAQIVDILGYHLQTKLTPGRSQRIRRLSSSRRRTGRGSRPGRSRRTRRVSSSGFEAARERRGKSWHADCEQVYCE